MLRKPASTASHRRLSLTPNRLLGGRVGREAGREATLGPVYPALPLRGVAMAVVAMVVAMVVVAKFRVAPFSLSRTPLEPLPWASS